MTRAKHTVGDGPLAVIGETANINYFVKTPLTPDSVDGVVNKQSRKKAHTRRRYVNDPAPANVKEHDYEFMVDPGRIDLQTLPGSSFVLDDGIEKRQFTFVGDVMDLHAWLVSDAKVDMRLYTSGPPYQIKAVGEGVATVKAR